MVDGSANNLHVLSAAISTLMHDNNQNGLVRQARNRTRKHGLQNSIHEQPISSIDDGTHAISTLIPASSSNSVHIEQPMEQEHQLLSDAMVHKTAETLSMLSDERDLLANFVRAARNLEVALVGRAEIHGLITLLDPSIDQARLAIAPVYPKLLLSAIDRRNIAASSATIALSDAFQVSLRVKEIGRSNNLASQSSEQGRLPSDEELPQWISNDVNLSNLSMDANDKHCSLDDSVFCAIEQLS